MKKSSKEDTLVVAAMYNNLFNANIALTKLRAAGIPAILNNETTAEVFGLPLAPYDTIRLLVFGRDEEEARRLLADTE